MLPIFCSPAWRALYLMVFRKFCLAWDSDLSKLAINPAPRLKLLAMASMS